MTDGTVYVIDDDMGVRDSLIMLLDAAGMSAVAHADAESFLARVESHRAEPGCIVADVRMPGMGGLRLLRHLQDKGFEMPVVVITGHADVPMAVQALKEGAADFIEKPFDDELFLRSVRCALDHGRRAYLERCRRADIQSRFVTLTPREREVMMLVVQGLPNKAAAVELGISVRTVEIHRARVMEKMAADSLSALVRMALDLADMNTGLLPVPA
ncbi:response regulator transcription factor [Magnetospirillum sp. SS-4]|uniref:response regulator transcription factor n=1 Tax=Magnetospirillum sp. SS-4 TaxID=2681465 RepID=UPI00137E47B6|nr:response regulator [Magnetospirillum sp. SS-4]CAA7612672.1 Transcriptional regulatory protein FixJ [Magnetospirillum sp. SS-4]